MGPIWPIRWRGSLPLGPWRQGRALLSPWPAHLPPCGISPTWGREEGLHPSLAYIRRGRVPFFLHPIEFFLSLFLLPSRGSHCLELVLGWGFLHHTHDVVLLESGSESIFFHCLSGSELGGTSLTPYACNRTR